MILLILVSHTGLISAQSISTSEWARTGSTVGLAYALELYGKDHLVPEAPRFTTPNALDKNLRQKLLWDTKHLEKAVLLSDVLVYGVSLSSLLWGPALANDAEQALYINSQVFAVNSLLTNFVKITSARERPYSYYGTGRSEGVRDFTSFYSGHSSIAFSQAVTNAMLLSDHYPEYESAIWSTLLGAAGMTAYFRVAGDKHYFSDVLVGSIAGALVGWTITRAAMERFEKGEGDQGILIKPRSNGFLISFQIPLG